MAARCNGEGYLRALEEQGHSMMALGKKLVEVANAVKQAGEALVSSLETNLRMNESARQSLEAKREPATVEEDWGDTPSSNYLPYEEDWDAELEQYEGRAFALPSYRTVSFKSWAVRCPACGGRSCSHS